VGDVESESWFDRRKNGAREGGGGSDASFVCDNTGAVKLAERFEVYL